MTEPTVAQTVQHPAGEKIGDIQVLRGIAILMVLATPSSNAHYQTRKIVDSVRRRPDNQPAMAGVKGVHSS
ncbi:MAG TPA: hypothetical protein VG125_20580 [Pirellulales bacterium]|nr:hypothetical protein [Pirellulales bacterium]